MEDGAAKLWEDAKWLSTSIKIRLWLWIQESLFILRGQSGISIKKMFAKSSEHLVFNMECLFGVSLIFVVENKTCQWDSPLAKFLFLNSFSFSAFSAKQPLWIFDSLKL